MKQRGARQRYPQAGGVVRSNRDVTGCFAFHQLCCGILPPEADPHFLH